MKTATRFKVGDRVQWDGSGSIWHRRIYKGTVIEMNDGYATVLSDEWSARCGVAFPKLAPAQD